MPQGWFFCTSLLAMRTNSGAIKRPKGRGLRRPSTPLLLWLFLVAMGSGCRRSDAAAPESATVTLQPPTALRLHWLGINRLVADTNAAGFMSIWNLPQTVKLKDQTLDKLALAIANVLSAPPGAIGVSSQQSTNPPIRPALLRPLLDDIINEECYLEVRHATNRPAELALAFRIDSFPAAVLHMNIGATASLLATNKSPLRIQDSRVQDWTLVGVASGENSLLPELAARIQRDHAPFPASKTNFWLDARVDPTSLVEIFHASTLPRSADPTLPTLSLTVIGEGDHLRIRGQADFPRPLGLELDPWNIPTNLLSLPLSGFTAARGLGKWLAALNAWQNLRAGSPPNQAFVWSLEGPALQTYFAAPQPDASNQVSAITSLVLQKAKPWLATNDPGGVIEPQPPTGFVLKDIPFFTPFLRPEFTPRGGFLVGGIGPLDTPYQPPPLDLYEQFRSTPNLLFYEWEQTGIRTEQWHEIGQFARFMAHRAQLPSDSAGRTWIQLVEPKLGVCVTLVTQATAQQLTFERKSTIGLSALELQLFLDWLESPDFPRGLHSFQKAAP